MENSVHSCEYRGSIYLLDYAFRHNQDEFKKYLERQVFGGASKNTVRIVRYILDNYHNEHWMIGEYNIGQYFNQNMEALIEILPHIARLPFYIVQGVVSHIAQWLTYPEKKEMVLIGFAMEDQLLISVMKRVCRVRFTSNILKDIVNVFEKYELKMPSHGFLTSLHWIIPSVKTINTCIVFIAEGRMDIRVLLHLLKRSKREVDIWNLERVDYKRMFMHVELFMDVLIYCIKNLHTRSGTEYVGEKLHEFLDKHGMRYDSRIFLEKLEDVVYEEEFWISFYMKAPKYTTVILDHLYYYVEEYEHTREYILETLKRSVLYEAQRIWGYVVLRANNVFEFTKEEIIGIIDILIQHHSSMSNTFFKNSVIIWCVENNSECMEYVKIHGTQELIRRVENIFIINSILYRKKVEYCVTEEECCVMYNIPEEYVKCVSCKPHIVSMEVFERLQEKICPYCRQSFEPCVYKNAVYQ